jgi:PAS domain S-box-containing protein
MSPLRTPHPLDVILRQVSDGITTMTPDGRLGYANEVAARTCGYQSAEEMLADNGETARALFDIFAEDGTLLSPDRVPTRLALAGGTPPEQLVRWRNRQTSEDRWSRVRAVPILDAAGAVELVITIFRDVTDSHRQEEKKRLLDRASALFATSLDAPVTLQRLSALMLPDFADWCVLHVEQPGHPPLRVIKHADPDKTRWAEEVDRRWPPRADDLYGPPSVLRSGQPEMFSEITDEGLALGAYDDEHLAVLRTLGMRSYLCVPLHGLRAPIGTIMFVSAEGRRRYDDADLALAQELADRAAAFLENARLYAGALRAEAERTDLLRREQEANRAKDEFLAMLGHELRNPLAPMLTALELMNLRLGDTAHREREVIARQTHHLVRLVDDLLDVSRITRGKIELKRRPLELARAVESALETTGPLLEQRRHHVVCNVPRDGLRVDGDEDRLAQAIANLLTNAAKYTDPGGQIEIIGGEQHGLAVLRVRDNGAGIAPELRPRLFALFAQGARTLDRAQGGLGLGLAIVQSLVTLHGGTVEAHSEGSGRGSEFVIRLPLAASVASQPTQGPVEPATAGRDTGHRVLVVDDNEDAAEVLAELLGTVGHTTHTVWDGPSALEAAASFAPQVAVLDIGLPVMNGYELADRLRAMPGLGGLKLIALTGYGQIADRARSRAAGFHAHLVKPVDWREVDRTIRDLLRGEIARAL